MGDRFVDIALLKVKREGGGLVELVEPSKLTVNRSKERKVVNTMNRARRGRGYRTATAAFTFELEVPRAVAGTEIDWLDMWDRDEMFVIVYEMGDGGARRSLVDCIIADVNDSFGEDGEAMLSISGMALDDKAD
jgi:hypothetical protein